MNRDDLMNALSGLDPKYIDEAAFELHDAKQKPGSVKPVKAKITNFRKGLLIALPAAAAAFLLIGVALALPALLKNSATQSASEAAAPAYEAEEAAAEAPASAAEAAAEAPMEDTTTAAEASENVYDANETGGYEAEAAAPMEAAETAAEPEPAQDAASINAAEAPKEAGRESAKAAEEAAISEEGIGLTEADFHDGLLTVRISGSLPADLRNTDYTITGTAANGSEKSIDAGSLDQILIESDPLTLDLSDLNLSAGTYTLTIDEESIEFEIP